VARPTGQEDAGRLIDQEGAVTDDPDADADRESFEHHRDVSHEIQEACDTVLAADLGTDRGAIEERLRLELTSRGHWPQPSHWVEAVVEEIQMGHHYRVSGT
jgi:hypothetical protein